MNVAGQHSTVLYQIINGTPIPRQFTANTFLLCTVGFYFVELFPNNVILLENDEIGVYLSLLLFCLSPA